MPHLTLEQRYKIDSYKNSGKSITDIAAYIGKDKSVVSREISRNSDGRSGVYNASLAAKKTSTRHQTKAKFCRFGATIEANVCNYISQDFSPEQAVGKAKKEGVQIVSIERIYQYIWQDKRKGGKLYKHLRTKGRRYRQRGNIKDNRGIIVGRVDISSRPTIVAAKERLGDLEIDLVIGKNHQGALLTINDRATGVLWMDKVNSKEASVVAAKTIELLQDWQPLIQTITSDNGKEFANHSNIAAALDVDYYFAKPYHSWERGANENLNGLIRQYFPKKYNFELITEEDIKRVTNILNNRPRKRFGFKTPNEIFAEKLNNLTSVAFIT
jgi:transposase, IS30 family